jgi:O-antigen ligase
MKTIIQPIRSRSLPLAHATLILLSALVAGYVLTLISAFQGILITCLLAVSACVFVWPEIGLYVIICSMLLSPEIVVGDTDAKATLSRGITLRLEDILLVAIGLSWFARNAVDKTIGLFRKTTLNRSIGVYILGCLLATLLGYISGDVRGAAGFFYVLKYFEYTVIFFMVVNLVRTPHQARHLLICLLLTCFIVSCYGLMQIPGGARVSTPFEGQQGEPNTFGGYLIFMGAVALSLVDRLKQARLRLALIALLVLILICLIYTRSRVSYLALVPSYLCVALFSQRRTYLVMGLIAALTLSPFILPPAAKERVTYTFAQPWQEGQINVFGINLDTSTSARLLSWQKGLRAWLKRPLLGYGVTGHAFMDAQYIRILVETGMVGLLAFCWLIYAVFRSALAALRDHDDDLLCALSLGLIAGLVGLLFHAMGANTFIIVRIMEPFWCLTGIVVALSENREGQKASSPAVDY